MTSHPTLIRPSLITAPLALAAAAALALPGAAHAAAGDTAPPPKPVRAEHGGPVALAPKTLRLRAEGTAEGIGLNVA